MARYQFMVDLGEDDGEVTDGVADEQYYSHDEIPPHCFDRIAGSLAHNPPGAASFRGRFHISYNLKSLLDLLWKGPKRIALEQCIMSCRGIFQQFVPRAAAIVERNPAICRLESLTLEEISWKTGQLFNRLLREELVHMPCLKSLHVLLEDEYEDEADVADDKTDQLFGGLRERTDALLFLLRQNRLESLSWTAAGFRLYPLDLLPFCRVLQSNTSLKEFKGSLIADTLTDFKYLGSVLREHNHVLGNLEYKWILQRPSLSLENCNAVHRAIYYYSQLNKYGRGRIRRPGLHRLEFVTLISETVSKLADAGEEAMPTMYESDEDYSDDDEDDDEEQENDYEEKETKKDEEHQGHQEDAHDSTQGQQDDEEETTLIEHPHSVRILYGLLQEDPALWSNWDSPPTPIRNEGSTHIFGGTKRKRSAFFD